LRDGDVVGQFLGADPDTPKREYNRVKAPLRI
jgi:hypothetical protein